MAKRGRPPGSAALSRKVRDLIESTNSIDQGVLLTDLMEVIGGSRALAKEMWREFQDAPRGGLARQKFLQVVQHLVISTTASNLTRIVKPETLTDEDLQDVIDEKLRKIADGRLVSAAARPEEITEESRGDLQGSPGDPD